MNAKPDAKIAPASNSRQVIGLDVVRFAAALLVVAYHFGFWENVQRDSSHQLKFTLLEPYVRHGFVGVDIFFVLSGVVIAYSAEHSTALRFAKSRILRLYPAVWVCSTLTFLALLLNHAPHQKTIYSWLNSLVLSPAGPWVDGSYWTLGVEMSFYTLLFFLLLANRFQYLAPLMTLIGMLSSAALICGFAVQHAQPLSGTRSADFLAFLYSRPAYLLLLRHGPLFALGVLLWLCFYHRFTPGRVVGLAVFFAGSVLAVHRDWADIIYFSGRSFSSAPSLLLWVAGMTTIVLSLSYNQHIARAVGTGGARFARAAGLATYPLYLIHQQLGDILIHHLYPRVSYPVALASCFCMLLAFSFAVVPYLELPLQKYLKSVLHIPRRTVQPAASLP